MQRVHSLADNLEDFLEVAAIADTPLECLWIPRHQEGRGAIVRDKAGLKLDQSLVLGFLEQSALLSCDLSALLSEPRRLPGNFFVVEGNLEHPFGAVGFLSDQVALAP
jgi:hypothetical protein